MKGSRQQVSSHTPNPQRSRFSASAAKIGVPEGNGIWYLHNQENAQWGLPGDIPVPADYNGDGKAEPAVWRPSNGTWYLYGPGTVQWGLPVDKPAISTIR